MDKKNVFIGGLLMLGGFGLMFYQGKMVKENAQEALEAPQTEFASLPSQEIRNSKPLPLLPTGKTPSSYSNGLLEVVDPVPQAIDHKVEETFYALENDYIRVRFTSRGGAIKDVALKKYPLTRESKESYVYNAFHDTPALALSFATNAGAPQEYAPEFKLITQSDDRILFSSETPEGVKIFRGYSLSTDNKRDPYVIAHETRFINKSNSIFNLKETFVNLGSFPPTRGDTLGEYLNVGYYNGKDAKFIKSTQFKDSKGFFGIGKRSAMPYVEENVSPLIWASVKNQFFAAVLTPKEPGSAIYAAPVDVGLAAGEEGLSEGVAGSIGVKLGQINPGEEKLLGMQYYVGPKEFTRLDALGNHQDQVMQFGFFGFISKFLLITMNAINKFMPNWGFTIISVTVLIKLILWPLTAIQVRSSKRMAKLQGPIKKIKEKYKDNPQKAQAETMKLFKEYRVNPAAGCLPLLVQLPIFLGLYFMLRTSSELRFANFLWIKDLSLPDTIAYISTFPVNILPLIMGASMFLQMRVTPTPTTDAAQQKIFQLMPFIFLLFCYNFPSGLVLYWTMQNVLTIVQQYITNKMKDPMDNVPIITESKRGKANKKKTLKKLR